MATYTLTGDFTYIGFYDLTDSASGVYVSHTSNTSITLEYGRIYQAYSNNGNYYYVQIKRKDGTILPLAEDTSRTNPEVYQAEDIGNKFYSMSAAATGYAHAYHFTVIDAPVKNDVTYNGSIICSLQKGQTATLACAGKKALGDIEALFNGDGSITYDGKEVEVFAGKTATMYCAGNKMKTDVVVRQYGYPKSSAHQTTSGTTLTSSVECSVGDLVVALIATRDTLTVSDGWTLVSTSGTNSTDTYNQRMSWAYKFAESTTETITVTQASAQRLYINMVALHGATGVSDNGYSYRDDATSNNMTVDKPAGLVLWGATQSLWTTTGEPYDVWKTSNNMRLIQLGDYTQSRLLLGLDQTAGINVTFTSAVESPMIVGSLSVQGIERFY